MVGNLMEGGNWPVGKKAQGPVVWGLIVQGIIVIVNNCQGGDGLVGNWHRGNCLGGIVLGLLVEGNCPEGDCPGGNCPIPMQMWNLNAYTTKTCTAEKSPIRIFFWSVFSCIRTEYGHLLRIRSEYTKIRTRRNSVFGHISCSVELKTIQPIEHRSRHRRCYIKISVFRNVAKFTGKHLHQSLSFNKAQGQARPATILEKRFWHRCFPVNFVKFSRISFLQNTVGWLLLEKTSWSLYGALFQDCRATASHCDVLLLT